MNIGVVTSPSVRDDILTPFLYPLTNGEIEMLDAFVTSSKIYHPNKFKIREGGHCYHFSKNLDDINYCDIKLMVIPVSSDAFHIIQKYENDIDYFIFSRQDDEAEHPTNMQYIKSLLERSNVIFIYPHGLHQPENPRCIVDYSINLYLHYHAFGFYYLNYYPNKEKQHLVGVYNRFDNYKPLRKKTIEYFRSKVDPEDIHIFKTETPYTSSISGQLLDRWSWQQMHISSYTDYNSAVANIVFETGAVVTERFLFSEKTVKSIAFQSADIFFIYMGISKGIEWLHEKGFWFLNSEFYDTEGDDFDYDNLGRLTIFKSEFPLMRSVQRSVNYLKTLKEELKTNNAVHAFLVEKYRDKLDANEQAFKKLLTNCEYKEKLLNLITKKEITL